MPTSNLPIVLRILDNENRLVERADQKSISLLSILGVFMVFFVVYYRVIPMNALTMTLIVLYFICALMAIISLIMAIRPRIRREKGAANATPFHDPAFFSGISAFPDAAAYGTALQKLLEDETNVAENYTRQIYNVARINQAKYKFVQRGVVFVICSLAIELTVVVYLFAYHLSQGRSFMPPIN
jgi:ABC-type bacteriocin/lantibiotic exporter with double-glycine peptidase domain